MSSLLRRVGERAACLVMVLFFGAASCRKKPPPRPAEPAPRAPIELGPAPALPFKSSTFRETRQRRPGTFGRFERSDLPKPEVPIRGALVPWHDGTKKFRPHRAIAATPVGDGSWILVLAQSGLWLLETKTLAVRGRLVADALGDVTATVDGARFAYGRCNDKQCSVDVRSFPEMALERSAAVDRPSRLRFAMDGKTLAVASQSKGSATVVDLTNGKTTRIAAGNDVNDALVLPVGQSLVAYGTDSDSVIIRDWKTDAVVFDSLAEMKARGGRGFDQNAIAYHLGRDELLVGGNDNAVWRFVGVRDGKPPTYVEHLGFGNDVEDIVVRGNGDILVGLDSGTISVVGVDGKRRPGVGRARALSSWGARLALGKKEDVVAVLGGAVVRWIPGTRGVQQSPFFGAVDRWDRHRVKREVLLVGSGSAPPIHRVKLDSPDPLEVESEYLGRAAFKSHSPKVVALSSGAFLIIGRSPGERLRVYRLPPGGRLSGPEDSPDIPSAFLHRLAAADGERVGYSTDTFAAEIDGVRARPLGELRSHERLTWDPERPGWSACAGECRPLKR